MSDAAPEGRRLVVEADGGSRGNPGPAGYGALVRDAGTGELLAEVAEAIGTATNNVAEYRGLLAGLRAAVGIDPRCTVEVRMDSKLVVEQMSGRWQVKHEDMRRLASQVRGVLPPERVTYVWVPRARNAHADRLANEALDAAEHGRPWVRGAARAPSSAPSASAGSSSAGSSSTRSSSPAPSSTRAPHPPDPAAATTLVLVRHGRTALTEEGRFSGRGGSDPSLSAAGEGDARRAAAAVGGLGAPGALVGSVSRPGAVLASPMARTRQTAAAIADTLGLQVEFDEGWAEIAFGVWDGLTYAEILRRWPQDLGNWLGSLTAAAPGGGESLADFTARAEAARRRTVAAYAGRTVVVVTHTTPVRAAVQAALEAGPVTMWRLQIAPCSVTVVRFWADDAAEVAAVNATAHLS